MDDLHKNIDFQQSIEVDLQTLSADLTTFIRIWENMFVQGKLPSWSDVDLLDFPMKIIPLITVVDIEWDHSGSVDGDAMIYRFWGTGHVNAKNIERTGLRLSENSDREDVVVAEYLRVINEKKPIAFRKYIRINKPTEAALQTTVRLPLSYGGDRIDSVLSASEWNSIGMENCNN